MSALNSVVLAIELATRRRDDAGRDFARVQRGHGGAQDQMEQLESYAAHTESKWAVTARERATPEIVRHYYQFMGRLRDAIELQRIAVADRQREFVAARKLLLDAEVRIASLNKLLERNQSTLDRRDAGREQKQLDAFAAMQQRRRRTDADTLEAA